MSEILPHRYQQLDGVRGIAILLVVLWHFVAIQLDPSPRSPLISIAKYLLGMTWSGVDLFFVLSGFLIGGILLDNRDTPNYFRTFYIRRICRIFPLYFAWFLLFILITTEAANFSSASPYNTLFQYPLPIWSYATFMQNFTMASASTMGPEWLDVTWSLAVEEQFYLILPLVIRFVPIQKLPAVLLTVIAGVPILRMILIPITQSTYPSFLLMPCRADALLLGVLSAWMLREKHAAQYLRDHVRMLYVIFGILLGGMTFLAIIAPSITGLYATSYGYTWVALFYTCLILIAMTEKEGLVLSLTKTRWLCHLGLLAYGVYMIHQAVNILAHGAILNQSPQMNTGSDLLVTAVALLATILLAGFSWHLYENRFVRMGHSFSYE